MLKSSLHLLQASSLAQQAAATAHLARRAAMEEQALPLMLDAMVSSLLVSVPVVCHYSTYANRVLTFSMLPRVVWWATAANSRPPA